MRRLILTLVGVLCLVAGGSAPAFAAPPGSTVLVYESQFLDSNSDECGSSGCSIHAEVGPDYAVVCFGYYDGSGGGCTDVDRSAITFTDAGATVAPTTITLRQGEGPDDPGTVVGEVTVSAQDHTTGGRVTKAHGQSHYKEGDCRIRSSQTGLRTPVAGTITVGSKEYPETGTLGSYTYTEISRGCFG